MDPAWDGASVRVWELSWPGPQNPRPPSEGPGSHGGSLGEQLAEERLSPARLALAQVDDLAAVTVLEMRVDTREHSLGNFGLHLPNLSQLKLNGSRLASVRSLMQLSFNVTSDCGLRWGPSFIFQHTVSQFSHHNLPKTRCFPLTVVPPVVCQGHV
ncbi:leucine-rich repeat-containing protein 56 isoform X2 [Choloepus didactylus]|uniref:leucine-rich repeat-containing protein 56 isoform X2 n=1 Tax=Choloepus didactylus TaxID=27675 RepID=UPI00189CCD75|nr:leucine-rich repeat-containing protein 56 isoform X2 [Choloepus didactylus]